MPEPGAFESIEHLWVPMTDGTRLSARLWIPERKPSPVVLEYIPYRKRDSYRGHDSAWGKTLASHGIGYARVDVRGTGDSEGTIGDEYSNAELADGVACIEWLAGQPWCNSRVGMRGISWGAINSLQIAALNPPSLKAILPIAGTDNRFTDDAHYIGGLPAQPNLEWGVLFRIVMASPPDPGIVGDRWELMWRDRLEASGPIITEWLRHRRFDDYWQRGSVCTDYTSICCPVYAVAGWQDTYSNPLGRLLESLEVPCKGLIGPWGHTYPWMADVDGLDWVHEEIRWWAHWLLDESTGIMDEPRFQAFMPYLTARQSDPHPVPGRWISESRWPPETLSSKVLRLNHDGIGTVEGEAWKLVFRPGPPVGLNKPEWLDELPFEQSTDDENSLVFDSEPLTADFEIIGYPVVNLRISAENARATVAVRLMEVTPTEESWLVSWGALDLAHRNSHSFPDPVVPGEFYDVTLRLMMTAHRFKSGHTLRVAVSDALWPMIWLRSGRGNLTLIAGLSSMDLPVREIDNSTREPDSAEGYSDMSSDLRKSTVEVVGQHYEYRREPAGTRHEVPGIGTNLSGGSREISGFSDQEGCNWQQSARRTWFRDGWHCEVEASCEMRESDEGYEVRESLKAWQDGIMVYQAVSEQVVPEAPS